MIHTNTGKTTGFTLIELLVVIGIMVVLMAIIVPATQSLKQGNRLAQCRFKLQQIGNAIRMYHVDYHGVPPVYMLETENRANPNDEIDEVDTAPYNNGLHILFDSGYLTNRQALHCPNDTDHPDPNTPEYYESFIGLDDDAKFDYAINRYKYMPCRTWNYGDPTNPNQPDGRRQLAPRVRPEWIWDDLSGQHRWAWVPVAGRVDVNNPPSYDGGTHWYPDDTSIITWCNLHVDEFVRQGEEMYQVLFWDGSVSVIPARRFTDDTIDPPAAWRVRPSDAQLD